jgi:hypothetical protein
MMTPLRASAHHQRAVPCHILPRRPRSDAQE